MKSITQNFANDQLQKSIQERVQAQLAKKVQEAVAANLLKVSCRVSRNSGALLCDL